MNKELENQYVAFKSVMQDESVPVLLEKIRKQIAFLKQVNGLEKDIISQKFSKSKKQEALRHSYTYKKALLDLVDDYFTGDGEVKFDLDFLSFNNAAYLKLGDIQEVVVRIQEEQRFHKQEGDTRAARWMKAWKRLFFALSKWPERTSNVFRKIFKKPVRPLRPWTHRVKLKNLTEYYLKEVLSEKLLVLWDEVYRALGQSTHVLWLIDEEIDHAFDDFLYNEDHSYTVGDNYQEKINTEIAHLRELEQRLTSKAEDIYEEVFAAYADTYTKAGTIELTNRRFSLRRIYKKHRALTHQYKQTITRWDNMLTVLSDDWEIDLELYVLIYSTLEEYYHAFHELSYRIETIVSGKLHEVKEVLEQCKDRLNEKKDGQQLETQLDEELLAIKNKLTLALLPETNEVVLSQDLPALINNVESKVDLLIRSVSQRRTVVQGVTYEQPVKTSAISYISPYELITFESWPLFQKVIKKVKVTLTERLNDAQNDIIDLGQIIEFNLESALSLYDDQDKTNDPLSIANEGVDRTIEKVESIKENLTSLTLLVKQDLLTGLKKFNHSLIKFTNNESVYEIRVRIARGKALERSKQYKEQLVYKVKNLVPAIIRYVRSNYKKTSDYVNEIFKKYGIAGQPQVISTELADFFAETEKSIEKLPFVYQRLFKIEPLTDASFFEGRKEELTHLNNAYNNWMKGRFASVIITGEKGSGITTLLNFYLEDLATSSTVHRFSPVDSLESVSELMAYFSDQFDEAFESSDQAVAFLNKRKRVIILENIQRLYLKKVYGFDALKLLTELISLTRSQVFWVLTATSYAWNYLSKTINLADHFSYHIVLKEFDQSTIVNIVNKRHRVSGYNVYFEPATSDMSNKKLKKLNEEERQSVLREFYFNELNKIAKSNVSLALIYWLRSTKEINGNTIVIGSLKDIDFSFMNNLAANKVYVLAGLLLHDGLSELAYCKVTGSSISMARSILQPLFEDGIIIFDNDKYLVNPLLYRQTVALLKMKNVIH